MAGPPPEFDETTTIQRAAIITYDLVSGKTVSTTDLVQRFGLSRQGAAFILNRIAAVVPIYVVDEQPGQLQRWRMIAPD